MGIIDRNLKTYILKPKHALGSACVHVRIRRTALLSIYDATTARNPNLCLTLVPTRDPTLCLCDRRAEQLREVMTAAADLVTAPAGTTAEQAKALLKVSDSGRQFMLYTIHCYRGSSLKSLQAKALQSVSVNHQPSLRKAVPCIMA